MKPGYPPSLFGGALGALAVVTLAMALVAAVFGAARYARQKRAGRARRQKPGRARLLLQCDRRPGHRWEAGSAGEPRDALCPRCIVDPKERVRATLERLTGHPFPETAGLIAGHPLWRLDGYCEALGVAFEYRGPERYWYTPRAHRGGPGLCAAAGA